jgi:Dolichyl-phosphate-mannose-protein mannosyltransferase
MHYVSLIVEFLRGRPALVFWTAALTQAALWSILPALVYSAPPGGVPILLAIGHEFVLGSYLGPPLAFWLGEAAFRVAGLFGVYVLAQTCVVVTYWAVFTLGRAVVGTRHAVLAILLMVGVAAFTVPSVDFGPAIMAAPFWALALLLYWRATGESRRGYWFLLAIDLGLLLLSSYIGLVLIALLALFTLLSASGRRALWHPEPWIAVLLLLVVVFPHLAWLRDGRELVIAGLLEGSKFSYEFAPWVWLGVTLLLIHLGVVLLVVLALGWPRRRRERAPQIDRNPVEPSARWFVYYFALLPVASVVAIVYYSGRLGPLAALPPLVALSGLAVVMAAGDHIAIYRERTVSSAWLGLLMAPPAIVVLGILVLPWSNFTDLRISQPATAEGRFFADQFKGRTGKPLAYVAGDERLAPLVALTSPSRPHVYFDWAPQRSPWASPADFQKNGGLLVWPTEGNNVAPPAALKAQFPDMAAEVPRSFARSVQGLLPLIRLGWAVVRPPLTSQR